MAQDRHGWEVRSQNICAQVVRTATVFLDAHLEAVAPGTHKTHTDSGSVPRFVSLRGITSNTGVVPRFVTLRVTVLADFADGILLHVAH